MGFHYAEKIPPRAGVSTGWWGGDDHDCVFLEDNGGVIFKTQNVWYIYYHRYYVVENAANCRIRSIGRWNV